MAKDASQITVAADGSINVAPYPGDAGLAAILPADAEEVLDPAFAELGYANEDGVTFTATPETEDILAWQSATPVRRLTTARELTAATSLEQWNQETFGVAFGGGTWSVSGVAPDEVFRYDPPADQDALAEFVVVIDAADGGRKNRWVIMKCTVTEAVESQLFRTGAALLPVTFSALTPGGQSRSWFFLSNDDAFAAVP